MFLFIIFSLSRVSSHVFIPSFAFLTSNLSFLYITYPLFYFICLSHPLSFLTYHFILTFFSLSLSLLPYIFPLITTLSIPSFIFKHASIFLLLFVLSLFAVFPFPYSLHHPSIPCSPSFDHFTLISHSFFPSCSTPSLPTGSKMERIQA